MSFFDTISRIIQQGKEMAVKATPGSKITYNKVTPVDNSQFTSNPLLRTQPVQYKKPVIQQPTFNVPLKAQIPQARTAVAETTPMRSNETMAQTVSQIIQGGKEAVKLGGGLAKEVIQGTARTVGTVGITAGNLALPGKPFASEIDPRQGGAFSRTILGDTTVKDLSAYGKAGARFINETTGSKLPENNLIGLPLAGLGIAMDLTGVGAAKKGFQKIASNMTAEDATILRNLYSKPTAKNVLPVARNEQAIISALKLDKLPYTEQKTAVDNILKEYDKRWGGVDEALNPPVKPNRAGAMDVKKPTPLGVDPKNFKTADEFVAAQGETTYRGASVKEWEDVKNTGSFSDREGTTLIDKSTGKPIKYDDAGKNTTTSKELADGYAKNSSNEGVTIEFKPEAKAKMRFSAKFDSSDLQADEFLGEGLDINDVARVTDKNGKVIYESSDLSKTKSQLTDTWNKANAKPAPVNKKLEAFKSGKPSSEGGYIRNPLAKAPEKSPKDNQVVSSSNNSIDSYVKDNIKKRHLARGEASISQKIKDTAKLTGVKLVDFTLPITNTLNKGLKKDPIARAFLEKNPSKNINNQIDRVLRAPALAGKYVEDKGLDKIIQQVKDVDEFDEYLIAKHAIDVDTRGINTGRNVKRDEQLVKALAPQYEKQAQAVMQYNRDLLDKVTEAGLISKETNKMLKERYPNYVPLQRVFDIMEDAPTQGSGRGVGSLSKQTVVQKLVGSDREIESPIKSILERTNNAVFQIEKNEAARLIASYEKLKDNPFNLKQINEVKDAGRGMGTISFFKDGKKVIYEVNEDVAEAAKALNVEQMNILNKILALPVRIARAGITGLNPAFIAKNVARDQVGAFIMADRGLRALPVNPVNFLKSLWATVKHDELFDEWVRIGGGGTSYDLGREQIGPTLKRIRAGRSTASKIKYTVTRPSEMLRVVEDIVARSEEITRLQQYRAARDSAIKRGLSADEAKVVGAQQSRENSTNFARRGDWGTVMNSTILYLNAGIQGSRLLIRNLKNKPLATSTKITSALLFPTATITYWNISDPERKKAYDDIQDYEKEINLIIVPPNPVQDERGKWNVIKIPLPPGVGNFASLVRLPIEKMNDSNPKISAEVAEALVKSVSPIDATSVRGVVSSITPQIIKPSIEAVTNKSLFTGNPIVYQSEEKLSPEMQVRDYTSGTAQGIANTLGVSPIKTEAFLRSTGGGITDNILNTSDRALVKAGLMSPDKIGGKSVLESIKGGFTGAAGGKTQDELTDKIYEIKKTSADNAEIRKQDAERILSELKTLPPEQANAQMKEIKANDEALFKKIKATKLAEDLNWNKEEKAIEGLVVTDGTKAGYVYGQVNKMKTSEEKNAYLKDLLDRKIISKEVLSQIKELKKSDVNNDIIQ